MHRTVRTYAPDVRVTTRHGLAFVEINGRCDGEGFTSAFAAHQRADALRRMSRAICGGRA